jgi:beta-barrel assembly-enhancing protease
MATGYYYDGETAVRHVVDVQPAAGGLNISGPTFERLIPADEIRHLESRRDAEIYGESDRGGWRLGIDKPIPAEIAGLLPSPRVYGGWIDRIGLVRAMVIGLVLSAAVILVAQFVPRWVAPMVPRSWERSFGDALVGDFGQKFCAAPGGQAALDRLGAKLGRAPGTRIRVVNVPIVNAAALPGGTIVIFHELLDEAEGPDEVAGVLAHEIAHVENRDVTELMIRQLGFSMLISTIGGTTGSNVEMLTSARYSRRAEARADADAIAALRRANISPLGTARFFERLAKVERSAPGLARTLAYLSSHPLSDERRREFERSQAKQTYAPALDAREWRDLKGICRGTRQVSIDLFD